MHHCKKTLPSEPDGLDGRPEAANLVGIHAALSDSDPQSVCAEFGGKGFSVFKAALSETAVSVLAPITGEMRRLMADTGYIDGVLAEGAARCRAIADPTMAELRRIVGLLTPQAR